MKVSEKIIWLINTILKYLARLGIAQAIKLVLVESPPELKSGILSKPTEFAEMIYVHKDHFDAKVNLTLKISHGSGFFIPN